MDERKVENKNNRKKVAGSLGASEIDEVIIPKVYRIFNTTNSSEDAQKFDISQEMIKKINKAKSYADGDANIKLRTSQNRVSSNNSPKISS